MNNKLYCTCSDCRVAHHTPVNKGTGLEVASLRSPFVFDLTLINDAKDHPIWCPHQQVVPIRGCPLAHDPTSSSYARCLIKGMLISRMHPVLINLPLRVAARVANTPGSAKLNTAVPFLQRARCTGDVCGLQSKAT